MGKRGRNKGGRRAYLKRFSAGYINTGNGPSATSWTQFRESYQNSAKSLGEEVPPTRGITYPRAVTVERLHQEWQGKIQFSGIDHFHYILIKDGSKLRVKLFFSGNQFFIVEENPGMKMIRRSIMYSSKQSALEAYPRRIVWREDITHRVKELPDGNYSLSLRARGRDDPTLEVRDND